MNQDQVVALVEAAQRIVDRHAERKDGHGTLLVPVTPNEMYKLRSSLEPFRAMVKEAQAARRLLVSDIVGSQET